MWISHCSSHFKWHHQWAPPPPPPHGPHWKNLSAIMKELDPIKLLERFHSFLKSRLWFLGLHGWMDGCPNLIAYLDHYTRVMPCLTFWHIHAFLIVFCMFLGASWLNLITHPLRCPITHKLDTPIQFVMPSSERMKVCRFFWISLDDHVPQLLMVT